MVIWRAKLSRLCRRLNNEKDMYIFMKETTKKKNYHDSKPVMGAPGSMKIKEHFKKGMTAFLVVVACIVCYFAFLRFEYLAGVFSKIAGLLRPIIYGIVIAYLLNPVMEFVEKYVSKGLSRIIKTEKKAQKLSRMIAIFAALIFALLIISALFVMLIPQLVKSVNDLIEKLPAQTDRLMDYVNNFLKGDKAAQQILEDAFNKGSAALEEWVQKDLFNKDNVVVTSLAGLITGVSSIVTGFVDIVIGFIVSIYALAGKEQFLAQGRKIIYATMNPRRANLTLHILRKSNSIFSGFIIGKLIDSAIIGVLCFIGVSILRMPYALLVSVFVGVTNIIPYFGPFIGAIPSALLIMIVDPMKGLYFIILIVVLQQLDGSIIGPKILGDSTGLSAFWVLFSILLFGGLFGVTGMIVGVPTFAVFYYTVKLFIGQKLEEKKLPVGTSYYNDTSYVDNEGNYVQEHEEIKDEEKENENADSSTE